MMSAVVSLLPPKNSASPSRASAIAHDLPTRSLTKAAAGLSSPSVIITASCIIRLAMKVPLDQCSQNR